MRILLLFVFLFTWLPAFGMPKEEPDPKDTVLNFFIAKGNFGIEYKGKSLTKRFSLKKIRNLLGEPDSVKYIRTAKTVCHGGLGRVGCRIGRQGYVMAFYTRFGLRCKGNTERSLREIFIDLQNIQQPNIKWNLLLGEDKMNVDQPILDKDKAVAKESGVQTALSSVLKENQTISHPNPVLDSQVSLRFFNSYTSLCSQSKPLVLDFDNNLKLTGFHLCFGGRR